MQNLIFYNSEVLKLLKAYSMKKLEYELKGIKKLPCEIMEEINNEKTF
jgi:hypothetical protein